MTVMRTLSDWRNLAEKIAYAICTFAIVHRAPHVGSMHDDRHFGRSSRNPSPFRGLTHLRSAPAFLAHRMYAPAPELSLIPVKCLPDDRSNFARKTGGLPCGSTAYSRRTNHV